MTKYEPVIGLEVHVELNTGTKMFCRCSADYFGKEPNTHTCPVCLGLPGALPYINQQAIENCIKIGLALNCEVSEEALFERKNYFYPDLPKGYQISQYRWPQTVNGWIDVEDDQGNVSRIRINRAHQEEDTGKLTHSGPETLIDYNRSSVPLVEIVTEPDFTDSSQIRDYAKKLQQIFRYLGVSNADMERGDMRLEANVSVRKVTDRHPEQREGSLDKESADSSQARNDKQLPPYRVELKNINSFRFMVAAVEFEIKRQIELYEAGREGELRQETRGWNEEKRETYVQRVKEEANDYRYFPEPDLPKMSIKNQASRIRALRESMPELPVAKSKRFIESFGISVSNAKILTESTEIAAYFEAAVSVAKKHNIEPKEIANFIVNKKPDIEKVSAVKIIEEINSRKSGVIEDETDLEKLAKEAIEENPAMVAQYKAGKITVIMAFVGAVMKKTAGKADANKLKSVLEKLLA